MRLSPTSPVSSSPRTGDAGRTRSAGRVAIGLAVAVALTASACGSSDPATDTAASSTTAGAATENTTTLAPTTQPPATALPVDVGTLEQTDEEPTESGPQWDADVARLWEAIVTDDPDKAMPFFFPEGAYVQVKRMTEDEATADYANRLIAYYEDDIHALHDRLGTDAADAELVGLEVPPTAQWIQPGVEFNTGSYWRVLDSTLVYTVDGVERSFPVVSMISWRGQWYIVHLSSIR